jgi:hypothetical protein
VHTDIGYLWGINKVRTNVFIQQFSHEDPDNRTAVWSFCCAWRDFHSSTQPGREYNLPRLVGTVLKIPKQMKNNLFIINIVTKFY